MSAPAFRLQADNAIRYQSGRFTVVRQTELESGASEPTLVEKREGQLSLFGLTARQLQGMQYDDANRRGKPHFSQ